MNGSGPLTVQPHEGFLKNVEQLIRVHYSKDKKGEVAFRDLLADLITGLLSNPAPPNSRDEPWPHGTHRDGVQFRKLTFNMPRQHGAAKEGRLMYTVDHERAIIGPMCVYTHKQFKGRPPDRTLSELLTAVLPKE